MANYNTIDNGADDDSQKNVDRKENITLDPFIGIEGSSSDRHQPMPLRLRIVTVLAISFPILILSLCIMNGPFDFDIANSISMKTFRFDDDQFVVINRVTKRRSKQAQKLAYSSQSFLSESHKKNSKVKKIPKNCESTVIILRHCEKDTEKSHCNHLGFQRAEYLATLFGESPEERWPAPHQLFAMSAKRSSKKVYREIETIDPIAKKIGLNITEFSRGQTTKLSKHIFQSLANGDSCGKLSLISWKHEDIPNLAQRLGCGPLQGCPLEYPQITFDQAWEIKFVYEFPRWYVYGSVQSEGFDPLRFSKFSAIDIDSDVTATGGEQ